MENYMNLGQEQVSVQLFPAEVVKTWQKDNIFYFRCSNGVILELGVKSDRILRFRFTTEGRFQNDFSYSYAQEFQERVREVRLIEEEHEFLLITSELECAITKVGLKIKILDRHGVIISEDEKGFHWQDHLKFGGDIIFNTRKIQSGEHFYGLGDKPGDLDLRGKRLELWGKDTYAYGSDTDPIYKNVPFFFGLHHNISYGIFLDNSFMTFFDFGMERKNVSSFWAQGGEMNYYFIYGPQLMDVARQYTHLTGKPELPPLWALGYHQCKWSYYPESKVREICTTFREKEIPCDSIYLDIDYMDGFRCFTWNKAYFPDPHKMIAELASQGFKTIVIIDPGIKIDENYWVYNEALENDYFCKRMDGSLMKGKVWPGDCNFPDFTNPEVREWWAGLFKDLIGSGVKGVWNDMNEPAVFEVETMPTDVRHDYDGNSCSHRKAHNVYGMQMARATYDGIKKFMAPDRPFVITRSGYAGVQRYSSVWTGDNVASWEHLGIANRQCQRLSASGISFCGSDIGGFIQSPSGELYARWIQLGIFHMFCRTHSSGDHGEQEPWSFGEEVEAIVKKYIELRYQLLPYFYTAFWQHVQDGTPVLRPLAFLDQLNSETHFRQDEFGVGDSLLVCPVLQADVEGRWTYLPEGNWYYFWNDELFEGGNEVWSDAPINIIPFYVRSGTVLPMYPVQQYVGEKQFDQIFLHVYLEQRLSESVYYEDAGDGYKYESGGYTVRRYYVNGEADGYSIKQVVGERGYVSPWYQYSVIVHGILDKPAGVECDGAYLEWSWNAKENLLSFVVDKEFFELKVILSSQESVVSDQ